MPSLEWGHWLGYRAPKMDSQCGMWWRVSRSGAIKEEPELCKEGDLSTGPAGLCWLLAAWPHVLVSGCKQSHSLRGEKHSWDHKTTTGIINPNPYEPCSHYLGTLHFRVAGQISAFSWNSCVGHFSLVGLKENKTKNKIKFKKKRKQESWNNQSSI